VLQDKFVFCCIIIKTL
jgi:hypothetical protein